MAEEPNESRLAAGPPEQVQRGDRRRTDRRKADRRREDRRAPLPLWRRPAAYVAYGIIGSLVLFLLIDRDEGEEIDAAEIETLALGSELADSTVSAVPTRNAFTIAEYEALLAEGQAAVGQVVRAELFCGTITPVSLSGIGAPYPALARLADGNGRVAGAECRWSRDGRTDDFLLIVPPELATEFARAPEVEMNFVRRRVIPADVEWLGRSESLALRTAGVLRDIR